MEARLGIAPIAWSNDDLPELGGDTPLETCLAEARGSRIFRHRDGRKVSSDEFRTGSLA